MFARKVGADGSVLASALIADADFGDYAATVDAAGNIYLAVAAYSYAPLATTNLPAALIHFGAGRLVHWEADGVAFGDYGATSNSVSNGVYLLRTPQFN